jgi:putative flippase GtrA
MDDHAAPASGFGLRTREFWATTVRQVQRFVTTGLAAAATDLGLYALLTSAPDIHPLAANLVSRPVGGLVSFLGNKHYTFRGNQRCRTHVQFIRFWAVWFLSFAISETLVGLLHGPAGLSPMPAKVLAEGCAACVTFLCHKYWTFS